MAKVQDIAALLARARTAPGAVFAELETLAASEDWSMREVAATAMVRIGGRHAEAVVGLARRWAESPDANLRRAACEGLRGLAKVNPHAIRPVLEALRADPALYVRKSVASALRNASGKHPEFVFDVCRAWARSSNPCTAWIVKEGLRKLRGSRPADVAAILGTRDGEDVG